MSIKLGIFSYPSVLSYVLGAQKNCLIETVLLSTQNICFGWEIRIMHTYLEASLPDDVVLTGRVSMLPVNTHVI